VVLAVHALVASAGDHVPEMANDAVGEEALAVFVEVEAPGIGGAVADDFEDLARRMIAPDAAVDLHAVLFRRSGLADFRFRKNAVPAIKPAVGTPRQAVDDIVARFRGKAVEEDDGVAGFVFAFWKGKEQEVWGAQREDAA